MYINVIY